MKADLQALLPPLHTLVEGRDGLPAVALAKAGERRLPIFRFRAS
jgi:hypothetical protein